MSEPNERDKEIACAATHPASASVIAAYREEIEAPLKAEVERLKVELTIDRAVCICGCPSVEHEAVEDGESCAHDDHACIRVCQAAAAVARELRAHVVRAEQEAESFMVERDEWKAKAESWQAACQMNTPGGLALYMDLTRRVFSAVISGPGKGSDVELLALLHSAAALSIEVINTRRLRVSPPGLHDQWSARTENDSVNVGFGPDPVSAVADYERRKGGAK